MCVFFLNLDLFGGGDYRLGQVPFVSVPVS